MFDARKIILLATVTASLWGCSDDDNNSTDGDGGSSTSAGTGGKSGSSAGGSSSTAGKNNGGGSTAGKNSEAGETSGGTDSGAGGDDAVDPGGAGGEGGGSDGPKRICPDLPAVLSLSGCTGIGPLCSVTQDDCGFTANCGGKLFDGTLTAQGAYTMVPPAVTDADGNVVATSCKGELRAGKLIGACDVKTTPATGEPETESCTLAIDPVVLAGIECLELPSTFDDLVICQEGAAAGGTTIDAGDCKVIQDGCNFQAECAGDLVLTGTASTAGISFRQTLKALADAQTPTTGSPAFLKGADVAHTCTGTIDGTSLTGTCGAGASGRNGVNTSVCALGGTVAEAPECKLLAGVTEKLFVLDSCEILKEGEAGQPGVGEPVCALRQNNCIWEVDCGGENVFGGKLSATATKAEFKLATGTPCEASFDQNGNLSGTCTVPGQAACNLSNKTAVPGKTGECAALPVGTNFESNGCGGGPLDCRVALQHGCDFKAICSFTSRYPSLVFTGDVNKEGQGGRNRLEFNGIGDYSCYVEEANAQEIATDGRVAGEWYGQCENSQGGLCRNNYNPTTGTGFRGLRLFFGDETAP